MKPSIVLQAVSRRYTGGDGTLIDALSSVDLEIRGSEFVSLLGPSGCGKSTLLKLVAGLEPTSSGQVLLGDEVIRGPDRRRGLVFQDPNLFPWLTVRQNVAFGRVSTATPRLKKAGSKTCFTSWTWKVLRLLTLTNCQGAWPSERPWPGA